MVSLVVGGRQELFIKKERYLFFSLILHVYTVSITLQRFCYDTLLVNIRGSQFPSRNISEFLQQKGRRREEVGKMPLRNKCDRAISCVLCSDPCQIFLCSGHLQNGLFKGR